MKKLHSHTRSIEDKCYEIWRSPGRFTKNPDIVITKQGRLLLVYSDNDRHWSQEMQILTILASDDEGRTWFKLSEVGRADLRRGDERLVTPRLSSFSDGRLAVLVDHDDYGHFHEEQPYGNWIYWSEDGGLTWSEPQENAIPGFEPDRIVELPDGRLAVVSQFMRAQSQAFSLVFTTSDDKGKTWKTQSTVAHDAYHFHCEGGLILLDGGKEYAVVTRENQNGGQPGFVVFSRDGGYTWTAPLMLPFHFHRPYGKQLPDGRVLVTGRNLLGGVGTYAWCGDLKAEAGYYEPGGPLGEYNAYFQDGAFVMENGPEWDCRYSLLPPENSKSDVLFEAELRVEGTDGMPAAFLSVSGLSCPVMLSIAPDCISITDMFNSSADALKRVDMRNFHRISLKLLRGLLTVEVDGKALINKMVLNASYNSSGDAYGAYPGNRTQFGQMGETGKSFWKSVNYRAVNPTMPDAVFRWDAVSGKHPDNYQRERLTLIHANVHPREKDSRWPDHGYSSWLTLPNGEIVFVDYTTAGDVGDQGHLVGARFLSDDV